MGAGETDVCKRQAREARCGVEDTTGPFRIEADGIDVDNGDCLLVIAEDECGGVKRKVGAEAALVGLGAPAALRRPGGGSDV